MLNTFDEFVWLVCRVVYVFLIRNWCEHWCLFPTIIVHFSFTVNISCGNCKEINDTSIEPERSFQETVSAHQMAIVSYKMSSVLPIIFHRHQMNEWIYQLCRGLWDAAGSCWSIIQLRFTSIDSMPLVNHTVSKCYIWISGNQSSAKIPSWQFLLQIIQSFLWGYWKSFTFLSFVHLSFLSFFTPFFADRLNCLLGSFERIW